MLTYILKMTVSSQHVVHFRHNINEDETKHFFNYKRGKQQLTRISNNVCAKVFL